MDYEKCKFDGNGVFWINGNGESVITVFDLEALQQEQERGREMFVLEEFHKLVLRKGIACFLNLGFDEGFGVSGRLKTTVSRDETGDRSTIIYMANQLERCARLCRCDEVKCDFMLRL